MKPAFKIRGFSIIFCYSVHGILFGLFYMYNCVTDSGHSGVYGGHQEKVEEVEAGKEHLCHCHLPTTSSQEVEQGVDVDKPRRITVSCRSVCVFRCSYVSIIDMSI